MTWEFLKPYHAALDTRTNLVELLDSHGIKTDDDLIEDLAEMIENPFKHLDYDSQLYGLNARHNRHMKAFDEYLIREIKSKLSEPFISGSVDLSSAFDKEEYHLIEANKDGGIVIQIIPHKEEVEHETDTDPATATGDIDRILETRHLIKLAEYLSRNNIQHHFKR